MTSFALPYWLWLSIGLGLGIGEMLATFFVLIWFGAAAIAVGVISWIFPGLGLAAQLFLFSVLSVALLIPARRFRYGKSSHLINNRAAQYIGRVVTLGEPIIGGQGQVFIGDTLWHVEGKDLPAGTRIRVVSYDNTTLLVEEAVEQAA